MRLIDDQVSLPAGEIDADALDRQQRRLTVLKSVVLESRSVAERDACLQLCYAWTRPDCVFISEIDGRSCGSVMEFRIRGSLSAVNTRTSLFGTSRVMLSLHLWPEKRVQRSAAREWFPDYCSLLMDALWRCR